jgi:cytochrome c-type biogenesis protein
MCHDPSLIGAVLTSSQPSSPTRSFSTQRLSTFGHALCFVLGFSAVFVIGWGGAATALGQVFSIYKPILGKIGGIVVIFLGLSSLRVIKIPWMYYDTRPQWKPGQAPGFFSSSLMGVFFAAGWTPCIGTTLGAILTLGFSQQNATQAMILSSGYALGLAIPFLAIGLGMEQASRWILRMRRLVRPIEIVSGVLLLVLGVLILTDRMTLIAIWALQHGFFLDLPFGKTSTPTYLIAVLAGLLSFLSPCVLPLVPAYMGYLSGRAFRSTPNAGILSTPQEKAIQSIEVDDHSR